MKKIQTFLVRDGFVEVIYDFGRGPHSLGTRNEADSSDLSGRVDNFQGPIPLIFWPVSDAFASMKMIIIMIYDSKCYMSLRID